MSQPSPHTAGFESDCIEVVLCDLDGVVWLAHEPIPGSVDAIARIRRSGRRVVFVTNNSATRLADQEAALEVVGVPAAGDVVTSAMAGASLVEAGERVLVAGGPGVVEAVERRGADAVINDGSLHDHIDAVIVGLHRNIDYDRLRSAARAVMAGARLIGTNGDTTFPTPSGLDPGGGALVQAVATVADVAPTIAGKPEAPMADLVLDLLSAHGAIDAASIVMVGDRPGTDGLFASRLGAPFALVRTGVTVTDETSMPDLDVTIDAHDLAAVADHLDA
ncbi:MAG: HAD-IIA family hydrolase [Actinomycetota bacterium]